MPREIFLIPKTLELIPSNKLPSTLQILERYYHLTKVSNLKPTPAKTQLIDEMIVIWDKASIPCLSREAIRHRVNNLVNEHQSLIKNRENQSATNQQRIERFKSTFDNLFDIANHHEKPKNKEDQQFLDLQRQPGRPGSLSSIDTKFKRTVERRSEREASESKRAESEAKRPKVDQLFVSSDSLLSDENEFFIDQDQLVESIYELLDKDDKDFILKQPVNKIKVLSDNLLVLLDCSKISNNYSFRIICDVLKGVGYDLNDVAISPSTICRWRRTYRPKLASGIKSTFQFDSTLTLHWDGKKIYDNQAKKFVEHLVIKVSSKIEEKLIDIVRLEDGKAELTTNTIFETVNDWQIADKIRAFSFDTTNTNTGKPNRL